ncbi:baseplate J/gp47 family protein [Pseudophaeobacter sp.]|jgi:phage-related baseplate assembly protein|uniref:baseplate J/gp47 family protein n=1 Tax=Pseudophaeobacter sp. TaxID=1971739 RepID=UPI0032D9007E
MADGLIDLSQLTPPSYRAELDFEKILAERLERLGAALAAAGIAYDADALESDPAMILQEADAYRELLALGALNDAYLSTLLPFASGADLDALGVSLHLLARAEGETDDRYRRRIALAAEQKAGGRLSGYMAEALQASLKVADAGAYVDRSTGAPIVRVPIMAAVNPPTPELVSTVQAHLDREDVRQATDVVFAEPVEVQAVAVIVVLEHLAGPDPSVLVARAHTAIEKVTARRKTPGRDLPRSALIAAAAVEGVERVRLEAPAGDVVAGPGGLIEVDHLEVTSERVNG